MYSDKLLCRLTELDSQSYPWLHLKHWHHAVDGAASMWTVNGSAGFCHHVVCAYLHGLWGLWVSLYSVLFVRHAKDLGAHWRSVGWMNRPSWTAVSVCAYVCCCVTVGEYHDIKQYHSGLCALTQGTLCTFLSGWGWRGWGRKRGGAIWWLFGLCSALAVLQLSSPLGKVMQNKIGRPLLRNNKGDIRLNLN